MADRGRGQSQRGTRTSSGGSASPKRSAAARKGAATRKAAAVERSQAAEQGAAERSAAERSAQDLLATILERGRRQTSDVLSGVEQLLGGATSRARRQAARQIDPVIAGADRFRRAAGLGPSFPISGYDDLTAAQVQARLAGLNPAELRKVRDYERRNANRKTVLGAIEDRLAKA